MIEKTETIHNFNKQCFIVTGGAQGLGGAITQRLAASNATVAIWDIDADASAQMKEQLGSSVEVFEADISNETSVAKAMANTIAYTHTHTHTHTHTQPLAFVAVALVLPRFSPEANFCRDGT